MSADQAIEEQIEIRNIRPAEIQVRTCSSSFDRLAIKELAASIRQHGLIQPITVRPIDSGFEIVAGHRRYQACKLLRWRAIPARVQALSDKDAFEIQLIENMHRMTMDPIEEAEAFKTYILDYGWGGVSELARILSKSEQYISSRIQLLRLPKEIVEEVAQSNLRPSHALELVNLDENIQKVVAEEIIRGNLPVKRVREITRQIKYGANQNQFFDFDRCAINYSEESSGRVQSEFAQIKLLKRSLLVLRTCLARLDGLIEEANGKMQAQERAEVVGELMQYRLGLHAMIDNDMKKISVLRKKLT